MTASKAIAYATVAVLLYASLSAGAQLVRDVRAKFTHSLTQIEALER